MRPINPHQHPPGVLTEQDYAMLADLQHRPRYFALVNAIIGIVAIIILCLIQPNQKWMYLLCAICGLFPGIWLGQIHLQYLRKIINKLEKNSSSHTS